MQQFFIIKNNLTKLFSIDLTVRQNSKRTITAIDGPDGKGGALEVLLKELVPYGFGPDNLK